MVYARKKMAPKARRGAKPRVAAPTTVKSLARQVKQLQQKTKLITERDQYVQNEGIDVIGPYTSRNLSQYSDWTKLWPSVPTGAAAVRSSMYHRYFKIDNLVTLDNINNEEGTINFTYMIISRRDAAGSAGELGNTLTLGLDVDYTVQGGIAFMNLKKFKIHYTKRFTLTGGDGADMQADNCQKRFMATIKVGCKVTNGDGAWKSLTNSPDPSDTFYAILFSDNSTVDLENPRWTFQCLHSVDN